MVTHPMSLIGYFFVTFAVTMMVLQTPLRAFGAWADFAVLALVLGICMSFLGVIARGFERIEAAILSRRG